jgi:hypothetical protein
MLDARPTRPQPPTRIRTNTKESPLRPDPCPDMSLLGFRFGAARDGWKPVLARAPGKGPFYRGNGFIGFDAVPQISREITTMQNFDHQTLELVLLVLVAVAMLVQALVLLAAFLTMRKAAKSMNDRIEEVRISVMPILETSRDLITKLAPRIDSASEDLVSITHSIRAQTADLQTAANEMVGRARSQANRLDSILTNFFDAMDRAGGFVADCINKPMRQLSALLASAKAVVESLRSSSPTNRAPSNHVPGDHDMFV